MKRVLRQEAQGVYYYKNGMKKLGLPPGLTGDISPGLTGNISPGLTGNISGLWGDISLLTGSIDDCELTLVERAVGVDISMLVSPAK